MISMYYNETTMTWDITLNDCLWSQHATHQDAVTEMTTIRRGKKAGRL